MDLRVGDLSDLVRPFDGASPAGVDLRLDASPSSPYFRLRDARSEARAAERAADNDPESEDAPDRRWAEVGALARAILAERAKDVEVACWLTEALTRTEGLLGLAAGARLLAGLIDRFWDAGLFPAQDPEDPEGRLVAITGMSGQERDGSLLQPLRKTVLWHRPDGSPVPLWAFERAREVAALSGAERKGAAAKALSLDDLEAEAHGAGRGALMELGRAAADAQAAWRALDEAAARASGSGPGPSTGRVRDAIDRLRRVIETFIPSEELTPQAAPPADEAGSAPPLLVQDAAPRPELLAAETREAMLDDILRMAAVFRRDEPNSPLGFTLEEAVRRARLPWPDLLRELMADDGARAAMLTVAGVKPPAA